jgi:hypothetical protein
LALGGYSSQTFVDVVAEDVQSQNRKSVLLYAGDFDPSGMDIDRDFTERGMCFDEVVRVALTADIVRDYDLPPMPGKATDSRSSRFMLEHGELVQVELDALPPDEMRKLYQQAIDNYWDEKKWKRSQAQENREHNLLVSLRELSNLEPLERAIKLLEELDDETDLDILQDNVELRLGQIREDQ